MKELLGKNLFMGDIVVTIVPRSKLVVAIVNEINEKDIKAKRIDNDKIISIKKDNQMMVIHENNFGGEYLEKVQALRAEVM